MHESRLLDTHNSGKPDGLESRQGANRQMRRSEIDKVHG